MISNQIISNCIEEAKSISGLEFMVADSRGCVAAKTSRISEPEQDLIMGFAQSGEDYREAEEGIYIRISDENDMQYVLVSSKGENCVVASKLLASQIKNLIIAYRKKEDKNSFFQNLLTDNLIKTDIYNRAQKLHIDADKRRCVFMVEPMADKDCNLVEIIKELFYSEAGDFITALDNNHVIIIKVLSEDESQEDLEETAKMLVDMAGSEAMTDVRVAYGSVADDIKGVPSSYKEAQMALEVSKIFYPMSNTASYESLGVGRLIYQLPEDLCRIYVNEIFGEDIPKEIDDEILATVEKFFDNSLNMSETSRQLFIHRNTLINRIEKIQKAIGLDVRLFDDALTLKIALMVVKFMKYKEENK